MATLWFAALTVKTETGSAEAGEHKGEALCFGNCCNTKYSTESGVAASRLICSSREDYQARPWQCPAEPRLSKQEADQIAGHLSYTYHKYCFWSLTVLCCTPLFWLPHQYMCLPLLHSLLKPISYSNTLKVIKRCCGDLPACLLSWSSSCVSSDIASSLRTAWQRRLPKMNDSQDIALCSQAQWKGAGGLLSLCQAACWGTSVGTGKTTRPTCALCLTRLSAASTPGPSQTGSV